jgi:hypothetical protein
LYKVYDTSIDEYGYIFTSNKGLTPFTKIRLGLLRYGWAAEIRLGLLGLRNRTPDS